MDLGPIPPPMSAEELQRAADLSAKQAGELTLLNGEHENKKREMLARHQREWMQTMGPHAAAAAAGSTEGARSAVVPGRGTKRKGRR